jgi:pilus assembly protein CpaF
MSTLPQDKAITDIPQALPVEIDQDRLDEVRHRLHGRLLDQLDLGEIKKLPEEQRRAALRPAVARLVWQEQPDLRSLDRDQLIDDLLDELLGLGPLERLLRQSNVTEILVNGAKEVYVERRGQLEESTITFRDDDHLLQIIERIVSRVGRRIDETSPMVDARLPDGSRVNAIIPPLALKGPSLSIRRFGAHPLTLSDLLGKEALTKEIAEFLQAAIRARLNVVVSGGTGSGKTTLLNVLSSFIPARERIITLEDAAELRLQQKHVVPLETRPANLDGRGAITMRDLLRNALRMRPDRIIVGECRGAETLDMLQAMNSGHEGSLTTLHANSPRDALTRLETMVLMSGIELPIRAMRRQIQSALHLIVQADRLQGGARRVTSVTELTGMEGDTIVAQEIFTFVQQGVDSGGRARGFFASTGVRPACMQRLNAAGQELPMAFFQQRTLGKV